MALPGFCTVGTSGSVQCQTTGRGWEAEGKHTVNPQSLGALLPGAIPQLPKRQQDVTPRHTLEQNLQSSGVAGRSSLFHTQAPPASPRQFLAEFST